MEKLFGLIPITTWEQLEGKTVTLKVGKADNYRALYGYDKQDGVMYVLAEEKK